MLINWRRTTNETVVNKQPVFRPSSSLIFCSSGWYNEWCSIHFGRATAWLCREMIEEYSTWSVHGCVNASSIEGKRDQMMDYQLVFRSHLCSSILQNGILVMPRDDRGLVAGAKAVMLREKIDQ